MKLILGIFRFILLWVVLLFLPIAYIGMMVGLFGGIILSVVKMNFTYLFFGSIIFITGLAIWFVYQKTNLIYEAIDKLDK